MKYTFKALPLAAFALTAALLFSSHDASALRQLPTNQHVGTVTCFINAAQDTVRLRRFVDYVQISVEDIQIIDHGFGLEKEIELVSNYCKANAINLCTNQYPSTTFVDIAGAYVTGNLLPEQFNWRCHQ